MNIQNMKEAATRASSLMKALSSETRLLLLCQMHDGEISVTELAKRLEMASASVSQQLSLLRRDNLVKTRRDGQTIYYSLDGDEAGLVISVLYALYCREMD
ncbi:MAG: metalloregulator ArsR/SmtB family transcription factor [Proteobacteria bacterium]|nr:metalloregulator ArsR/SmtB family transcription factor [Pseudomonadota bacterium]